MLIFKKIFDFLSAAASLLHQKSINILALLVFGYVFWMWKNFHIGISCCLFLFWFSLTFFDFSKFGLPNFIEYFSHMFEWYFGTGTCPSLGFEAIWGPFGIIIIWIWGISKAYLKAYRKVDIWSKLMNFSLRAVSQVSSIASSSRDPQLCDQMKGSLIKKQVRMSGVEEAGEDWGQEADILVLEWWFFLLFLLNKNCVNKREEITPALLLMRIFQLCDEQGSVQY